MRRGWSWRKKQRPWLHRMMEVEKLLIVFMSVWRPWMWQLQRNVLLKFCLVLDLTSKCKQRKLEIFLVAGE
uniref:Uncharacterized protein n=1 Tax=Populus trichocarpa TaxID=3694 RepID=A9PHQ4_POPTR|nr:unknown [Populus trichocarpa]